MKIICKRPWLVIYIYVYNANTYLVLHRVMKTNYFTLFVSALFQLHSIYGSTNHHNYARWMILCALELLNSKSENHILLKCIEMVDSLLTELVTHLKMLVLQQTINALEKK